MPPEKGGSTLLFLEGTHTKGKPYTSRVCVRNLGDRREVRWLGAQGGFVSLSLSEGRTMVDTDYFGAGKTTIREFSADVLKLEPLKVGERRAYEVLTRDGGDTRRAQHRMRAIGERVLNVGACRLDVVDLELTVAVGGWTITHKAVFAPSIGYATSLDTGPYVRGTDVRNEYKEAWTVVRIGGREEAGRLCDDFTS